MAAELEALLARAASDPVLVAGGPDAVGPVEIRRNVRVALHAARDAEIVRFSWCTKWRDAGGRFHARTFVHEPRQGPARTYDFPEDPWLPAAAAPGGPLDRSDVAVLRYIPTRRITFCSGELVGKFKRARTVARSYAILEAVHAAAGAAGVAVPEPMGLDSERGVFYQQRMPGQPVAELVRAGNAPALMRGMGALHAAIHRLEVRGVPERPLSRQVAGMQADAAWVAFALPAEAGAVAEVERRIVTELDASGAEPSAFVHGDPALDQVLLDGERVAVVDFDDAGIGDPYADLGAMVASLGVDASRLEGAAAAYLDGYREAAGRPLDERRLRAHVLRARLATLASRLRKGRLDIAEAVDAVARLRAAARER
jgi:aminoglycoside phosphotransferase (APT) family kinase protein